MQSSAQECRRNINLAYLQFNETTLASRKFNHPLNLPLSPMPSPVPAVVPLGSGATASLVPEFLPVAMILRLSSELAPFVSKVLPHVA